MYRMPADADVNQWLRGGVYCNSEGTAYIYAVQRGPAVIGIEVPRELPSDDEGKEVTIPSRSTYLCWPRCGAVNLIVGKIAANVVRLPARQWTRTFCAKYVTVNVPRGYELLGQVRAPRFSLDPGRLDVLNAVFYPKYPASYMDALRWLDRDEWLSVALDRRTILLKGDGKVAVYKGDDCVGYVIDHIFHPIVEEARAMKVIKSFKGAISL